MCMRIYNLSMYVCFLCSYECPRIGVYSELNWTSEKEKAFTFRNIFTTSLPEYVCICDLKKLLKFNLFSE